MSSSKQQWTAHATHDLGATIRSNGRVIATEISMVDAQYLCEVHNASVEPDKPTRPSILDEEWNAEDDNCILNQDGHYIASTQHAIDAGRVDRKREIAALPDALRALVKVKKDINSFWKTHLVEGENRYVPLTDALASQIDDALKKAWIE